MLTVTVIGRRRVARAPSQHLRNDSGDPVSAELSKARASFAQETQALMCASVLKRR